jgi:hypothetical protein
MLRELQAPLLAVILLGACVFKLSRVLRARSVAVVLGATVLFPEWLRRPAAIALCGTEMSLGLALLATAGRAGVEGPADAARVAAALFFLVGMCALVEMREQRPDLGCGCFGDLSSHPPGVRSVIRAGLFAGMALAGIRIPAFRLPPPGPRAAADLGILAAELLLLALVSPEIGEVLVRLGYAEPCEVRPQSPRRALAALRGSRGWRAHAHMITGGPADVWRELCWWYLVYPGRDRGQDCEVVFAVEVKPRRPAIHAAVVRRAPSPPAEPVPQRPRSPVQPSPLRPVPVPPPLQPAALSPAPGLVRAPAHAPSASF